MQSNRTFLFVFMQCKVQEVVCCHSKSVLAQLLGLMMMSHAYPLLSVFDFKCFLNCCWKKMSWWWWVSRILQLYVMVWWISRILQQWQHRDVYREESIGLTTKMGWKECGKCYKKETLYNIYKLHKLLMINKKSWCVYNMCGIQFRF